MPILKFRRTINFLTMKLFKFLKGSITALALVALVGFAQKAQAQYTFNPVTVDINPQEFQALYNYGVIPAIELSPASFIANGTGGGVAPWPPITGDFPCPDAEGMTPALAQQATDAANQWCRDVYICVREKDCNFYLWVFTPTDPNCFTIPIYQASLPAYAL
jgi:hypothetical protein